MNVFLSAGGGKQLERSFHFDKVRHRAVLTLWLKSI